LAKKPKEKPQESIKAKSTSKDPVSWVVFLFTISIVLISFVTVVFPAAIVVSDTLRIPGIESVAPDPFETGPLSGGVIAVNVIILALAFLYFKGKLPASISSKFRGLYNFEVSRNVAFFILAILLVIYIASTATELSTVEIWADYIGVKDRVDGWSIDQILSSFEPHVKYFLTWVSMELFGNYKVIPFLASIGLLITVYFITKTITQKRFAGIIAMIILMQSKVFLTFDTSVAYTNFWILFYLLSLYFVFRLWPLSPILYILSIPSKYLTAAFFPMSLFFIYRSTIPRKKKVLVFSSIAAIFLIGIAIASALNINILGTVGVREAFSSEEFWMGFTSFAIQLRFDGLVVLFLIPLIVGLFVASRKGIKHAESFMVLISGILFLAPLLTGFTDQTNQPYRFVPLVVFFAIGVGVLLSKRQA